MTTDKKTPTVIDSSSIRFKEVCRQYIDECNLPFMVTDMKTPTTTASLTTRFKEVCHKLIAECDLSIQRYEELNDLVDQANLRSPFSSDNLTFFNELKTFKEATQTAKQQLETDLKDLFESIDRVTETKQLNDLIEEGIRLIQSFSDTIAMPFSARFQDGVDRLQAIATAHLAKW